jgi:hypothetical protein
MIAEWGREVQLREQASLERSRCVVLLEQLQYKDCRQPLPPRLPVVPLGLAANLAAAATAAAPVAVKAEAEAATLAATAAAAEAVIDAAGDDDRDERA